MFLGVCWERRSFPKTNFAELRKVFPKRVFARPAAQTIFLFPTSNLMKTGNVRYVRRRKKLQMRTDVFYFSGSGNSRAVAVSVAEKLGAVPFDITEGLYSDSAAAETAAVVFPVYCQNVPPPVKVFLPTPRGACRTYCDLRRDLSRKRIERSAKTDFGHHRLRRVCSDGSQPALRSN